MVDFVQSPKSEVDYRSFGEAEREAEFRRKRQEFIAEKLARKKQLLKLKKEEFGTSSSDDSDEQGGSRSSGSSAIKSQKAKKPEPRVQTTPVKQEVQPKYLQQPPTPSKKKSQSLERISINVLSKKNEWNKDVLVIGDKTIIIQNLTQQTKKFSKIKIMSQTVLGSPFKTKITVEDQEIIFSVSTNQEKAGLPPCYYTFAKLIQLKLAQSGVKLREGLQQKIPGVPESLVAGSLIYGKIYKKSQVLGNWQQRFILVNKEGIFSYKKFNQKHSMFIAAGSINQMWTRFQIQDNLLIVKIWHSSKKTQFGFPLVDYLTTTNWLYSFYCMMGRK